MPPAAASSASSPARTPTPLAFLAHGGHGCISVTANVAPRLCAEMHDAWRAGRPDEALALHRRLMPLHHALFCETSPAPAKYALSRLGPLHGRGAPAAGRRCRERAKAEVDAALVAVGLAN